MKRFAEKTAIQKTVEGRNVGLANGPPGQPVKSSISSPKKRI